MKLMSVKVTWAEAAKGVEVGRVPDTKVEFHCDTNRLDPLQMVALMEVATGKLQQVATALKMTRFQEIPAGVEIYTPPS